MGPEQKADKITTVTVPK